MSIFEVREFYDGRTTTLYTTDDEGDAYRERDYQIEQWADQDEARKCVYVKRSRKN